MSHPVILRCAQDAGCAEVNNYDGRDIVADTLQIDEGLILYCYMAVLGRVDKKNKSS